MSFTEVANADVFLFVTGVAVIFITSLLIVVLLYLAEILHDIRHISKTASRETDHFTASMHTFLHALKPRRKRK